MDTARRLNITMQFFCGQMLFRVAVLIFVLNFYTHISAEQVPRYVYRECYRDRGWVFGRAFSSYDKNSKSNSLEWCTRDCLNQNKDYTLMGVESGDECYCGSEAEKPTRHGLCSSTDNDCECDHQCPGNEEQICGGDWALSIYYISWELVTSPSTITTTSITPTTVSSTASSSSPRSSTIIPQSSSSYTKTTNKQGSVSINITNQATVATSLSGAGGRTEGQTGGREENSTGVYIGAAIAGGIIVILIICLSVFLIKRRRPEKANPGLPHSNPVYEQTETDTPSEIHVSTTAQPNTDMDIYSNGDIAKNKAAAKAAIKTVTIVQNDMYGSVTSAASGSGVNLSPGSGVNLPQGPGVNLSQGDGDVYYEAAPVQASLNHGVSLVDNDLYS